jgi:hypothetical protein
MEIIQYIEILIYGNGMEVYKSLGPAALAMIPALASLGGAVIGGITGAKARKRQEKRQDEYNKQQMEFNERMMKQQNEMGLQNWRETYEKTYRDATPKNQMKLLKEAGLNQGMMYGMGGAGGVTGTGTTGNVSQASMSQSQAPYNNEEGMGMQLGLDAMMKMAQIKLMEKQGENIEADTGNKQQDTSNKEVENELLKEQINNLKAKTTNEVAQNGLIELQKELTTIDKNFQNATFEERAKQYEVANEKYEKEIEGQVTQNKISKETADEQIKQAKLTSTLMEVDIQMKKAGIELTKEQTIAIAETLNNAKIDLDRKEKEYQNELEKTKQSKEQIDNQRLKQIEDNYWNERNTINQEARTKLEKQMTQFNSGSGAKTVRGINTAVNVLNGITNFIK